MKSETIYDAITNIRDELIVEATEVKLNKSHSRTIRWCAIAASFALVIGIGSYILTNMGLPFPGANTGGSGHVDGSTEFMSYAGPVFPLTVLNSAEGISASRDIAYDFEGFGEPKINENGLNLSYQDISVSDNYILTNNTDTDLVAEILYPFAGTFSELYKLQPALYINDNKVKASLLAGQYSGSFQGIVGRDEETTHNLDLINSWEDYKQLISDGEYLRQTFSDVLELNQTVTVYAFTNPTADHDGGVNPTIAAWFNLDYEKTTVLCYGFDGGFYDQENNIMRQSFSVPNDYNSQYGKTFYLVVVGDDIESLKTQGYVDGSCDKGKELAGTTVDVYRYEAKLADVLNTTLDDFIQLYYRPETGDAQLLNAVDMDMLYRAAVELLTTYGKLTNDISVDRYQTGRLEDMFSESMTHNRVFYLSSQIFIPAGESVSIRADSIKLPSFDFYTSNNDNLGLYGYDMVTRLGSILEFDTTTARLLNPESIVVERQNFGFDIERGITEVSLDMEIEHYYLEIRGQANSD